MSETPDQARTRRRWISLAEIATVAGLVIGAGGLYLNWSDRSQNQTEKAATARAEDRARSIATLTGTVKGGDISLNDPQHSFSGATVRFPSALSVAEQDAMPGPTIDKDWFAAALLKATDGGADERTGRLPVLITVTWWDADRERRDTALYDILWRTKGHMFSGRSVEVTGFTLRARHASAKALDAAWTKAAPSS